MKWHKIWQISTVKKKRCLKKAWEIIKAHNIHSIRSQTELNVLQYSIKEQMQKTWYCIVRETGLQLSASTNTSVIQSFITSLNKSGSLQDR